MVEAVPSFRGHEDHRRMEKPMREAVIVSAVRTAVGKAGKGTLKATRPDDMGAVAIKGALERVPALKAEMVEDVRR